MHTCTYKHWPLINLITTVNRGLKSATWLSISKHPAIIEYVSTKYGVEVLSYELYIDVLYVRVARGCLMS